MSRPSPGAAFGNTVGAGFNTELGCLTVMRVNGCTKGGVGGLLGPLPGPLSKKRLPALVRALTLKPDIGISKPALVSRPILSISRRLKPAAMISRLFLAACCFSFSALRSIFEMFAIRVLLFRAHFCARGPIGPKTYSRECSVWVG